MADGVDVIGRSVGGSVFGEDGYVGFGGTHFLSEDGRDEFVSNHDFGFLDEFVGLPSRAQI